MASRMMDISEDVTVPDSDIIRIAETGDSEEVLRWYREQSDKSLYFFNKEVLGYQDLTPSLHAPVCDWLISTMPKRGRGLIMPRKFFKSTNVKGYVLHRLRKDTNLRFLFVGENDKVGGKNLTDVRWHLQNNRLLRALYPEMIPAEGAKWTESEIMLPRDKTFDEPTITTIGIGAKHTGFHYNEIIYDDPIGLVAADSPAEMNAATTWFEAAQGLLDSPASLELIVGTRWMDGIADTYGYVMEKMPYRTGACEECDGKGRRGSIPCKFCDGTGIFHEGYVWYVRQAIEDGKSIFPERYPMQELEKIRKRLGPRLWAANMMNDPAIPGNQDFPDEWIRSYTVLPEGKGIRLEDGETVYYRDMVRMMVYDPSSGGISAEAENAVVVAGMDMKRRIFVLEDWAANCGFSEGVEKCHKLNDKWRVWKCYYEAVGAHKEVGNHFKNRPKGDCPVCKREHRRLMYEPIIPPGVDKDERIRTLAQPSFEEKRVYLRPGMEKLRRQITGFPFAKLKDRFDALAYCISKMRAPTSTEAQEDQQDQYQQRASTPRSNTSRNYGGYA